MSKPEIFDDSFFAALMDELCEDQGQELAEECARLNELDEFENEELRLKRGEETIDRELQRLLRQKRRSAALKSARLLSIAALAVLVVGLASYMAIPQFRSRVQAALDIEPQTTSGIVIVNGGNAATGGVEIRPPEEYEEISHTYDYTEDGIVETITYRHPETGDEYVVSVLNKYPTLNYDSVVITPPVFTFRPYNEPRGGVTIPTPNLRSSWDYQTGGGSVPALGGSTGPKPLIAGADYNGNVGPKSPLP